MNPSSGVAGKSLPASSSHPPAVQAGPSTSSFESARRPNQPGPGTSQPTPRKGQNSRKQHKNQRRPGAGPRPSSHLDEDDAMAEMRALRNPSSRRGQTSITHLLSYAPPRPFAAHGQSHHPRSYRRHPTWGPGYAADKSRYVHANYRFVVSPDATYSNHAADADVLLDWLNVMQIIASAESQSTSCPICLSEPVAPRMAKCGHIFCLPCLIRFMHSNSGADEPKSIRGARWKKCPICEDSVYLHEVRPVRFYVGQESSLPRVGDDVVLRLMARNANSTLALPWEGGADVLNSGEDVPWHFAANVMDYARIMLGTAEYMDGQYEQESMALLEQEKEDETMFGQDGEWTQKAIKAIEVAKKRTEGAAAQATTVPTPTPSKQPTSADFYFYSSPPHLYLSPLDIRILKTKYGAFSNFPSTLLPRVEHISTGHVVDDALRKRAKYLGHLPYGCVISFLECDWTDIVPAETLASFSDEIERRRKRNRDKAAEEERERLQAERLEAAMLRGSLGTRRVATPVEEDAVPVMDLSEFQPLTGQSGTTPPDPRPGFATLASMSTSPSTQRTVWGTRAVPASPELEPWQPSGLIDDGWLKDEELLDTAELAMQMEAMETADSGPASGDTPAVTGKKGKKKKQKITLMSTGGRRAPPMHISEVFRGAKKKSPRDKEPYTFVKTAGNTQGMMETSPSLTSTSHTLTALPLPPRTGGSAGLMAAPDGLLSSLRPGNRHVFLKPSATIPSESLRVVKETLEGFAGQVAEQQQERRRRKRKRIDDNQQPQVLKLSKVHVDGFQTGQVWQQAKRIIGGILKFSEDVLGELEESGAVGVERQVGLGLELEHGDDEGGKVEQPDAELEDDQQPGSTQGSEDEQPLPDDGGGEEVAMASEDDEVEDGIDAQGDQELTGQEEEYVQDPHGLNDGFFSIDNFNRQTQWLEEQEARRGAEASDEEEIDWAADPFAADDRRASQADGDEDDDGPTFGDMELDAPDGESEENEDAMKDDGAELNANDIYYKDFFAPPPRKNKGNNKLAKSVKWEAQEPAEADVERAMADVRRDLFDDESEDEGSDASAGGAGTRRSTHERRLAKLADEIRKLEAASVAKREWMLSGEAAAADRPMDSLLEQDLDFEHVGKPVPVVTPEINESIDELIKRRILAQDFDEVIRRRPDADSVPAGTRRGMVDVDDRKAEKSLAELYEDEHVKRTDPEAHASQADAKLRREEAEVEALWKETCGRLDALSSWHYKPKPAAPTLSIVADVATVSMEDAQPGTAQAVAGESSRMAPHEVYRPGDDGPVTSGEAPAARGGAPLARAEMSREDRARRRRRQREKARKAGAEAVRGQSVASKRRRDTLAALKKGGVKVVNRKGDVTDVEGNKGKQGKDATRRKEAA
ncbi:hypothetical protein L249_4775 [Ophiocordyceps polyrhachis-furcata BCC 54312]|uniref:RING-type domain-containing protein n=1 Tax=Ophiocordyceps polyrhachis-furcata BCC 54312 TaxID=1330021 RepID=A0A367L2C9_9HYPO|nr:hypothetical protein L249_4775 [Ophiocordyceps polyrhachis-furcata BCC 54312]